VLIGHILAKTRTIRVGSGGVLLQHYSPFKVAETFKVLANLAPGRVDLGIGKAPGGLPLQTRALQARLDTSRPQDFEALLAELDAFLTDTAPANPALAQARAKPHLAQLPGRILLGGSPGSAVLAARLGWDFAYAGHFNGDPENIERSVRAYRDIAGKPAILALYAFVAEREEDAQRHVAALRIFKVHLSTGQSVNLPSREAAVEFAAQAGVADYRLEETRPHVVAGTPEQVRQALDALATRYGVAEFVIDTPVPDFAARNTSIELLAHAIEPALIEAALA
jgi:luciferase family oxidoreductase group 1